MNLVREVVKDAAVGVGVASTPEGLSAIHRPGCAAGMWRRDPLPSFQAWIDALEPEPRPSARIVMRPKEVRQALEQI